MVTPNTPEVAALKVQKWQFATWGVLAPLVATPPGDLFLIPWVTGNVNSQTLSNLTNFVFIWDCIASSCACLSCVYGVCIAIAVVCACCVNVVSPAI